MAWGTCLRPSVVVKWNNRSLVILTGHIVLLVKRPQRLISRLSFGLLQLGLFDSRDLCLIVHVYKSLHRLFNLRCVPSLRHG